MAIAPLRRARRSRRSALPRARRTPRTGRPPCIPKPRRRAPRTPPGRRTREGDETHRPNVASVFLGATTETAEDETYFTVGAEYERRLSSRWGFQLAAEYVSDFDAWVVGVSFGAHF